jgi:hypothetical protein
VQCCPGTLNIATEAHASRPQNTRLPSPSPTEISRPARSWSATGAFSRDIETQMPAKQAQGNAVDVTRGG